MGEFGETEATATFCKYWWFDWWRILMVFLLRERITSVAGRRCPGISQPFRSEVLKPCGNDKPVNQPHAFNISIYKRGRGQKKKKKVYALKKAQSAMCLAGAGLLEQTFSHQRLVFRCISFGTVYLLFAMYILVCSSLHISIKGFN